MNISSISELTELFFEKRMDSRHHRNFLCNTLVTLWATVFEISICAFKSTVRILKFFTAALQ